MTRSVLYHALAELLAAPADWMTASAREWVLSAEISKAAHDSPAARRLLLALSELPAETQAQRMARYDTLFNAAPPRHWLYESAAKTGRILGAETFEVAKLYRAAGLISAFGAEAPDHACIELDFLAYLSGQAESNSEQSAAWRALERQFIREHGAWLIQLGRSLAQCGDTLYAPVGQALADCLTEDAEKPAARAAGDQSLALPAILRAEDCTLCGFCAQVCPTHALAVLESDNSTALTLNVEKCDGCGKCEKICDTKAITLNGLRAQTARVELRVSPRVICPSCKKPTVSRAELDYVGAQLGYPEWLNYCLECRPKFLGG